MMLEMSTARRNARIEIAASTPVAVGTLALMLLLALAAFVAPHALFDDQVPEDVSDLSHQMLRNSLSHGNAIEPLLVPQITEARMFDSTPDAIEGTVVWRSLFGVQIGQSTQSGWETTTWMDLSRVVLLWTAFVAIEVALGGLLLWQWWHLP
jgi:hypothetical protein